ncbi:MAG TPA: Verru_Chthon cassette protein A [Candidatus Methylacidiphilales bacterium]|nr:Verru_Chthon cassette protein A [Candidatus Methylacidiphilales bacterium]
MRIPVSQRVGGRGFALVVVLSVLAILTVLTIAFLGSMMTEVATSKTQANTGRVQLLADSVPQLVISRISDATAGRVDSANSASAPLAWASQPGMIRTYRDDGTPDLYYRLYSGGTASVPGSSFSVGDEAPPVNWNLQKGVFTDLNSPVIRTDAITGTKTVQFPIVDPRARTQNDTTSVAGFDYKTGVNGVVLPGATPDDQRLPMPMRWLYVLSDGTFATPSDGISGTVSFATGTPTDANPIVGRIAFWTDDETSKVNINTASEGMYYDIPHYCGAPDYVFSMYAPVIGEYQRYPGHPATTCLSAVLKPWLPSPNDIKPVYDTTFNPPGMSSASPRLNTATSTELQTRLESYLNLAPRFRFGGSKGGTDLTAATSSGTVARVPGKIDRLYSSVDELLYSPDKPSTERTISNAALDKNVLEKARFFLTANNRAPEVNLFGLPRVAMWPISKNTGTTFRTSQDTLIAFCSTLGSASLGTQYPFYFQRDNPKSSTDDYNKIPRNISLFTYLQTLSGKEIPGFGGSLLAKYGVAERDQILTEMFDYIRSCNLNDPNLPTSGTYTSAFPLGGTYQSPSSSPYRSPGLVVPIKIGNSKGGGRYPIIDQAFLVFYTPELPDISNTSGIPAKPELTETKIRAALMFNFFYPTQGFMLCFTNVQLDVTSIGDFKCEAVANADPAKHASLVSPADGAFSFFNTGTSITQWANANERGNGQGSPRNFGGNHGHSALLAHKITEPDARKKFNLVSKNIPVIRGDPLKARWNLRGGTFKVTLRADQFPLTGAGDIIQTYEFEFPDSLNVPIPTPGAKINYTTNIYSTTVGDFEANGKGQSGGPDLISRRVDPGNNKATLEGGDVVRGLQVVDKASDGTYIGGDLRRLSFVTDVPKTWFSKNKNYDVGNYKAHSLRDGYGAALTDATASGVLLTGVTFSGGSNLNPFVRSEINGVYASRTGATSDPLGDWCNGFGITPDGAYLNRADEGVAYDPGQGGEPYYEWTGAPQNKNLTSPNKQIPSAGMFGSLSTGTTFGFSWQTLLFRPDPTNKHPGRKGYRVDGTSNSAAPADYMWLDLFHMPVVEPYAISEPFSSAGRINMNCQMMPFTYITRETGIWAVLMSERILCLPSSSPSGVKSNKLTNPDYRYPVNIPETLKGFQARFAASDIFRAPAEICSLDIIPKDTADTNARYGSMPAYWNTHKMSGDNVKERPYTTIYPRLTTKSNTYTVHFIAQTLKKVRGTADNVWIENRDQVSGEYRGSAVIERYVDPGDPRIPDFAAATDKTIESYYRWRINTTKRFAP